MKLHAPAERKRHTLAIVTDLPALGQIADDLGLVVEVVGHQPVIDGTEPLYRNVAGLVMDVEARPVLVYGKDNGAALVRLIGGKERRVPAHAECQHDHQRKNTEAHAIVEALRIAVAVGLTHLQAPF